MHEHDSAPNACSGVRRCSDRWGALHSMTTWCASRCLARSTNTFVGCGGFLGSKPRRVTVRACKPPGFHILAHDVTSAYVGRFYTRLLTLYTERRTEFAAMRGLARYQEG